MNKIIYIAVISLWVSACASINGNGRIKSQAREVSRFNGIESRSSVDIDIKKGSSQTVTIEADENLLQYVTTEVINGDLIIELKPNSSFGNAHLKAHVTSPELKSWKVSGSGSIRSNDFFDYQGETNFIVSGSGDIEAVVHSPSVIADVSGSGSISLKGETKNFRATVSGSGDAKCHDLKSENTSIEVGGSGSAHVYSSVKLTAQVSGSGDIFYSGNPASPSIDKSGSGSIQSEK